MVFEGLGEDEFVDEQDDEFGGIFRRREHDLFKDMKPFLQVFKELAIQFRFLNGVLGAPHDIQQAATLAIAREQVGKGEHREEGAVHERVAGAEEIRVLQIGEDDVFVAVEVFPNLREMLLWLQFVAAQFGLVVDLKERLEFEKHRPVDLGNDEVNKAVADVDLRKDTHA